MDVCMVHVTHTGDPHMEVDKEVGERAGLQMTC